MRPIYDKTFIIYPMESPTFHSITQANISRIQNVEKVVLFFYKTIHDNEKIKFLNKNTTKSFRWAAFTKLRCFKTVEHTSIVTKMIE